MPKKRRKPWLRPGRRPAHLSAFGRWMDRNRVSSAEIRRKTGLGANTIVRLRTGRKPNKLHAATARAIKLLYPSAPLP